LAQETGTPLHEWAETTIVVDNEGKLLEAEVANLALGRVWDILERAIQRSSEESDSIDPSLSLYDEFANITQKDVESGEISDYERRLILEMAQMWGAYVGDGADKQSMKFFFLEDCIGGDDCFIPTNYKKILDRITALPRAQAHIKINTIMTSVTGSSTSARLAISDGSHEDFDDVVITTPLGYLKRHKDSITPLDLRLSSAIDQISYGHLEKVLIEFPHAFWDASKEEAGRRGTSFMHWLSPSYASDTNPSKWRLETVNFNAFDEPYRRNILLFYTYGDCSLHITSSIRSMEKEARDAWLRHFFEPYYSRLPNYDPTTCAPLRYFATEWANDEFAGFGSYCNFQVGMDDAARDVETIRYGMPDHHIYFAGEHTAPFDGLGTVAGAYQSGEAIARRIIASAGDGNKA
jgi:hypothetical protein